MDENTRIILGDGTVIDGAEAGMNGNELAIVFYGHTDVTEIYPLVSSEAKTGHIQYYYNGTLDEYFGFTTLVYIALADRNRMHTGINVHLRPTANARAEVAKDITPTETEAE